MRLDTPLHIARTKIRSDYVASVTNWAAQVEAEENDLENIVARQMVKLKSSF